MTPPTTSRPRKLSTREERRETVLAAAVRVFAERGYHAASTVDIAKAAGISQAYVFRLFPTKAELFAGVCEVGRGRLLALFADVAARARAAGVEPLEQVGKAYNDLLQDDRDLLLVQLHGQTAAVDEPLIRDSVRRTFRELYALLERETGADAEQLTTFFARGMLCNVMAALDADALDEPWARALSKNDEEEGAGAA